MKASRGIDCLVIFSFWLRLTMAQQNLYLSGVRQQFGLASTSHNRLADELPREFCGQTNKVTVCANCTHIAVCVGSNSPRSCPNSRPYCNTLGEGDACLATPDPLYNECSHSPSGITCTSRGFFPDPIDCQKYHICASNSGTSDVYHCPDGYMFNLDTLVCERKTENSTCFRVNCSSDTVLIPYAGSRQLYAYCDFSRNKETPTIHMFRCPNMAEFDGHFCRFRCPSEGRFANSNDPTMYYECTRSGPEQSLVGQLTRCRKNRLFNRTIKQCDTVVSG
ncbi:uncharacterized protein LOC129722865 [Wyeomyia smithii]|uniref:uncharacterized protein LOC129722865 n=1 Tax=Wyeomyia smithii TaxID=174621 RepID=UPI0024681485|nr:uncharacterized protein LOC129722865 [Wyeomyia smithii]